MHGVRNESICNVHWFGFFQAKVKINFSLFFNLIRFLAIFLLFLPLLLPVEYWPVLNGLTSFITALFITYFTGYPTISGQSWWREEYTFRLGIRLLFIHSSVMTSHKYVPLSFFKIFVRCVLNLLFLKTFILPDLLKLISKGVH